jgi:hypothetical protein
MHECLATRVRELLGSPKMCKLAHALLWEYSHKRLKLAQLLGQLGGFLTEGCTVILHAHLLSVIALDGFSI